MRVDYNEENEESKNKSAAQRVLSEPAKEERKTEKVKGPSKREVYEKKYLQKKGNELIN